MNVVVDTSIWIDFFKGRALPLLESAMQDGRAYVTPVIVAELLSGVRSAKQEKQLLALLSDLPLVDAPFTHWVQVGRLRALCLKKGFSLSTPDAHIAQACLDIGAALYSQDNIFKKIQHVIHLSLATELQ